MGCHFLLQGIFPTQGLNLHLLRLQHYSQILYWSPGKSKLEISEKSLRSLLHRINGHLMVFYFISSCLRFSKDSTLRREEMKKNMGDHWNLGSGTVRVKMKLGTTEAGWWFWELLVLLNLFLQAISSAMSWMFPKMVNSHSLKSVYFFIYLWLCWVFVAALGLSLVVAGGGYSLSCGFSSCEAWALGHMGFSSCSSWALEHRFNSCGACA